MKLSILGFSLMIATTLMAHAAVASDAPAKAPYEAYTVGQDIELHVLDRKQKQSSAAEKTVRVKKGADITVLGVDVDATYGEVVRVGLDDNDTNTPADFWVQAKDLANAGLQMSDMISEISNDPLFDAAPEALSDAADRTLRHAAHRKHRMTYCYRFVKQFLLKTHQVSAYLPGVSAWMAAGLLPKYGFHNTGHTQYTARMGEVCVYRGGNGNNGHIEVKRPQGWWYGYGYHGPITDRLPNHPLVGCFAKKAR